MAVYANSNGSSIVLGVTADSRINMSASSGKKRQKNTVVNLGNVFPETVTVEAEFTLYNFGMSLLAGEFTLATPDGLLTIENLDACVGLVPASPGTNEIPLVTEFTEKKAVASLYMKPGEV